MVQSEMAGDTDPTFAGCPPFTNFADNCLVHFTLMIGYAPLRCCKNRRRPQRKAVTFTTTGTPFRFTVRIIGSLIP